MLAKRKIWLDGKLVPFGSARTHIMSHSFCRGSAVFEVMSLHDTTLGPAVFRLDEHISRLVRSAQLTHMKLPLKPAALKKAVLDAVKANKIRSGMVKLMCYYGEVEFEVVPRNPQVTVAVVAVDPLQDLSAERFKKSTRQPAKVTVARWRRADPRTVPIEAKCAANYLGGMIAKLEALAAGFTSPVLLDLKGNLAEGATESIFIVKNGVVKTPALDNILSGITRKSIIDVCREYGIPLKETAIKPAELKSCDEAFFTSSMVKVWPIAQIENRKLDHPGDLSKLLDGIMDKVISGQVKKFHKWLTPIK